MKIAVCDVNISERVDLCALIRAYCERNSFKAEVRGFASGAELMRAMRLTPYGIVFLEVLLGEEHGIRVAQAIRKHYPDCVLFFCTTSKKYAIESYELNALHYILKPVDYKHVKAAMQRCGDILRLQARTLLVSLKPEIRILLNDILFVEIYDKSCHIHTDDSVFTLRTSITKLEGELGKASFLRCHRSFIVNMEHVIEYAMTDFIMDNGERVPIRQSGRAKLKRAFRDYINLRLPENASN